MRQQRASTHTIASYRDTFRLLLGFASQRRKKSPSELELRDFDAPFIVEFLDDQETQRAASTRTRHLRLPAIRSFFRFVAFEEPAYAAHIQRELAIPSKRGEKRLIHFLNRSEIEALLGAPDRTNSLGRGDHALLSLAIQTGLRLSELTSLDRESTAFGTGAHVSCVGKGRKERCTPLSKALTTTLQRWLKKPPHHHSVVLFPNERGGRLNADAVSICSASTPEPLGLNVLRCDKSVSRLTYCGTRQPWSCSRRGVDCSVIALWLGHESMETTQVYLHAHTALKEAALAKIPAMKGRPHGRCLPPVRLLQFLHAL